MNNPLFTASKLSNLWLPVTGMLWWPIPLLCGAGLLCLLVGFLRRR